MSATQPDAEDVLLPITFDDLDPAAVLAALAIALGGLGR